MSGHQTLSEDDISVKFITPALHKAGWDEDTQIRRQVSFTKGRIIVRGRLVARGRPKRADFVLYYQHIPIALIEAKKADVSAAHGMQQALDYAASLDVPFVFSSNGQGFVFHAKAVIAIWTREYNEERPKPGLGGLTPAAYAKQLAAKPATFIPDSSAACY